jgi:hypothetical protein
MTVGNEGVERKLTFESTRLIKAHNKVGKDPSRSIPWHRISTSFVCIGTGDSCIPRSQLPDCLPRELITPSPH